MADKKGRVQEIIQRNVSEIVLYDLKSPLCQYASINEVQMSKDYSYCKIYVSHLRSEAVDALVSFLNKNAPRIRSRLAQKLSIYKTPELRFFKDEVYEKARHIDDVIARALASKPKTLKDIEAEEKAKAAAEKKKKGPTKRTATTTARTKKATGDGTIHPVKVVRVPKKK